MFGPVVPPFHVQPGDAIMVLYIVIAIVILIAAILVLAAMKPDSFRLERRATIQASPDKIFGLLNDFHKWAGWSPWEKLDPAMSRKFGGPESGVGSSYECEGNSKAGKGRMEITESTPSSRILLNLDFIKPFEAHNITEFNLVPNGQGAELTWSMYGPSPFMSKVMTVFASMDKMVGKEFEKGLANLKGIAESTSA